MELYCKCSRTALGLSLLFLLQILQKVAGKPLQSTDCGARSVAKYKLTFETFWSRDAFYKQYPLYRPKAHWSKLVGRSHSPEYTMWSLGHISTDPLKAFVETSDSTLLDEETQGSFGILDAFYTAGMPTGVGRADVEFLVDSAHSQVSAAAKLVPSPDWFVGIDSIQLCQGQTWIEELTFDLDPLDAGTDQGYTYTSPNWPEDPPLAIFKISSSFPNHPASSFLYPDRSENPRIGKITLRKVEVLSVEELIQNTGYANDDARVGTAPFQETRITEDESKGAPLGAKGPSDRLPSSATKAEILAKKKKKKQERRRKKLKEKKRKEKQRLLREQREKEKQRTARLDCILSDWSEWSACTKTCGYGTQTRRRTVIQRDQNGGMPCDTQIEEQMCGSMKNCKWEHFNARNWGAGV